MPSSDGRHFTNLGIAGCKRKIVSIAQADPSGKCSINAALQSPVVAKQANREAIFALNVAKAGLAWAEAKLQELRWTNRKLIAIFLGGTYAHKRWSPEKFLAVCRKLASDPTTVFFFISSSTEHTLADPIAQALPGRSWNACGTSDLHQLAALLVRAELFLENYSGPAHLAAALGRPSCH